MTDGQNSDNDFIFSAFDEQDNAEQTEQEIVTLPQKRVSRQDMVAKILSNNYYLESDKYEESVKRFLNSARDTGEWHSAMVKTLRAMLGLDATREAQYVPDDIPYENLQSNLNSAIFEAAMEDLTNHDSRFYGGGGKEAIVSVAIEVNNRYGINAERITSDPDAFAEKGLKVIPYYGESIDDAIRQHEQQKHRLAEINPPDEITQIARVMIEKYPILKNRQLLDMMVDVRELSYTVSAAFAPEIIDDEDYRQGAIDIIKSEAPARLKFIASMMCVAHDNCLNAINIIKSSTLEGYKK